jgi:hypothetical protein
MEERTMGRNNRKRRNEEAGAVMMIIQLEEHNRVMPPMVVTETDTPIADERPPEIGDRVYSVWGRASGTVVDYPIQGAPDGLTVRAEVNGHPRYLLWDTRTPRAATLVWHGEPKDEPDVDYAIIEAPVAIALEEALTTIFGVSMFMPLDAWRSFNGHASNACPTPVGEENCDAEEHGDGNGVRVG